MIDPLHLTAEECELLVLMCEERMPATCGFEPSEWSDLAARVRALPSALRAARDGGLERAAQLASRHAADAPRRFSKTTKGHIIGAQAACTELAADIRALKGKTP